MEMQMEAAADLVAGPLLDRLATAAAQLEAAAARLASLEFESSASRESELAARLAEAEQTIATLRAGSPQRKTAPALLSREGIALEAASLDAALASLSLEQRIAVKAQLLRTGFLG